ncbi:hypothetical protein ACTOB_003696 [Actinoplanes oblitus]|uniref:Uncharacterized protein n=1 Tax=Actinoplanes oblitus TaxID=3040509 RepID=A0ABY8WVG8_9ACTN|nr:hypothetical protein [Actinoplanes oblitus]WIN00021.1 hypothetical protein ACTOB_003696 [Actinoplanes oblitus]
MGYTHYWQYQPASAAYAAVWPRIVADTRRILTEIGTTIALAGPDGTGTPLLDLTEGIAYNGARPDDFETFDLAPPGASDRPWGFCKTERRPYDLAVTATLLRCHLLLPDEFGIGSDGNLDSDWAPAHKLIQNLFDTGTTRPQP